MVLLVALYYAGRKNIMGKPVRRAQRKGLRRPLGIVREPRRIRREVGRLTPDWLAKHGHKPGTFYVEDGVMYLEVLTQGQLDELKAGM